MKVRMINNETKSTDSAYPTLSVISSHITIRIKTETDEDISRYNDLIVAIEQAIDEATTTTTKPEGEEALMQGLRKMVDNSTIGLDFEEPV